MRRLPRGVTHRVGGLTLGASLLIIFICGVLALGSCGGGSGAPPPPPPTNPPPTIGAISPNSSDQGGAGFTLSVVGSNFVTGSTVQWGGSAMPTTFVSNALVTAEIPASALNAVEPDPVTVASPAPGGGISGAIDFKVPCPIPAIGPAATQTSARVGAYYFDGWSGPLTNYHFQGLPLGAYQSRQPLSAWQDGSACALEQQLADARSFGVDFFVFDWYFNAEANDPGENLNSALQITRGLPDRHGMQYAILYVDGSPFDVTPSDWTAAVNEWVSYMTDPAYLQINGMPAFFIINVGEMRSVFETSAAVVSALQQLRAAAKAQGLAGVYIVGGFGAPDGTMGQETLDSGFLIAGQDGYDAVAFYNYPFAPPAVNGMLPFSTLSEAGQWTWNQAQLHSPVPFIATAMAGWDPRPWNEAEPNTGDLMWYARTPQDVAGFVGSAIAWANSNPQLRPEPSPTPPLVLIEAWNEFGEGSYILPTIGDGTGFGVALGAMLMTH